MANKDKETATWDYWGMIIKSWTFARLTRDEQNAFMDALKWGVDQGAIFGNYKQRWMICEAMYTAFLNALGYEPIGWREPTETKTV